MTEEREAWYICRLGELVLKGRNRRRYENRLLSNIRDRIPAGSQIALRGGRILVRGDDGSAIARGLAHVFGLSGFAPVTVVEKDLAAIIQGAVEVASRFRGADTFRVSARREDKSFPFQSPEIEREVGASILESMPGLSVDLRDYDASVTVEVRDRAYIYGVEYPGLRGLPVGTAGKALLLLSGGIDSPVAGAMMASRGVVFDAIHFHSYPYTSEESQEKVRSLAQRLSEFVGGFNIYSVPITEIQTRIRERARRREHTLLLRGCMMQIANRVSQPAGATGLITGDSLSQVASQTMSNIRFADDHSVLPVYRPLLALDKEEIIERARRLGTFETSTLPYPDCCTLFAPQSPITNSSLPRMRFEYEKLEIAPLLERAAAGASVERIAGPGESQDR